MHVVVDGKENDRCKVNTRNGECLEFDGKGSVEFRFRHLLETVFVKRRY